MGDYLKLQFVMLSRRMRHWGLNPFVGYPLAVLLFVGVCKLTFDRAREYAPYIIVIVCVMFQMMLCDKDRADFLLSIFGDRAKTKVRIAENLIVALPFVITLGITYGTFRLFRMYNNTVSCNGVDSFKAKSVFCDTIAIFQATF